MAATGRLSRRSFVARVLPPGACLLMLAAAPACAQQGAQQGSPPPEGSPAPLAAAVYTAEQAARGEAVFRGVCGNCHASGQFAGAVFQKAWAGRPVYFFFDQIRTTMPQDNPGGLSAAEYAAVIAYVLKLNGYPAGAEPLPAEDAALRQVRFGDPPSPRH